MHAEVMQSKHEVHCGLLMPEDAEHPRKVLQEPLEGLRTDIYLLGDPELAIWAT